MLLQAIQTFAKDMGRPAQDARRYLYLRAVRFRDEKVGFYVLFVCVFLYGMRPACLDHRRRPN